MADTDTAAPPAAAPAPTPSPDQPVTARDVGALLADQLGLNEPEQADEQTDPPADTRPRDAQGRFITPDATPPADPGTADADAAPVDAAPGAEAEIPDDAWLAALPPHIRELVEKGKTAAAPAQPAQPQPNVGEQFEQRAAGLARAVAQMDAKLLTEYADFKPGDYSPEAMEARHKLASEAPARAAAFQQIWNDRAEALNQHKGIAEQQYQSMYQRNVATLRTLVPEWQDGAKMQAGVGEVKSYLASQIMTIAASAGRPMAEEQAKSIAARTIDPVEISIVRKAMLFDRSVAQQAQARAAALKKVPPNVPPVQRPGARTAAPGPQDQVEALRIAALKSGTPDALGAFINGRLNIRN